MSERRLSAMRHPIRLSDSTPYYEKYFLLCDDTPHAYVSAFREAQFDALRKRRIGAGVFWTVLLLGGVAWLLGVLHLLVVLVVVGATWVVVSWHNRREAKRLARTFELALRGKEREFHEYMWRHLDRRMLKQAF